MRGSLLLSLLGATTLFAASASAQIFQNFFGGQQQEQREQEAPPVSVDVTHLRFYFFCSYFKILVLRPLQSGDAAWFEARVEAGEMNR